MASAKAMRSTVLEKRPPALEGVVSSYASWWRVQRVHLRFEDAQGDVPGNFSLGDEALLGEGLDGAVEGGAVHTRDTVHVLLENLVEGPSGGALHHLAEEGKADVGVDGAGVGEIDGRSLGEITDQVGLGAGNGAGEARAGRASALGDLGQTHLAPGT